MSDRVHRKSRSTERSSSRRGRKKKSEKRLCSSSDDCVVITGQRNSCGKEKRRKSRRKKRRRRSSSDSSSSDSNVVRIKLESKPKQLLGKRAEFCKNSFVSSSTEKLLESKPKQLLGKRPEFCKNARSYRDGRNSGATHNARSLGSQSQDKRDKPLSRIRLTKVERQILDSLSEARADRKEARERSLVSSSTEKLNKSRRRRRSSSSSSSTSDDTSSQSSSAGESSSCSSTSSDSSERRRRRRRRKEKKLAKKLLKREEKKRKEEKRKLKRLLKEKVKAATAEVKHGIVKAPQDRLLKDINVELADRARAMAPMTREQWEKKQSVVRRVFDEETGRQRLIKGDGEVLEEIVSRDRHMAINKKATKGDGEFFQSRLRRNK